MLPSLHKPVCTAHLNTQVNKKKCFKYPKEYDYGREGKPMEWDRTLWVNAKIRDFTPIIDFCPDCDLD